VSSAGKLLVTQSVLQQDGAEEVVEPGSADWLAVETVSDLEEPVIPLQQGYFQVTLPGELLTLDQELEISWVDFFR
jgi:hypothetical protein